MVVQWSKKMMYTGVSLLDNENVFIIELFNVNNDYHIGNKIYKVHK